MKKIYKIDRSNILFQLLMLKQVTFEVTDSCNLKCKYCGYGELYDGNDDRENHCLPIEKVKNIIDYLAELWENNPLDKFYNRVVFSFYGGEPLLNMDFIKCVIAYAEQRISNRALHYSMTTNAILLHKHMNSLVEKKFDSRKT